MVGNIKNMVFDITKQIDSNFSDCIELISLSGRALSGRLKIASKLLISCIESQGKILACGNGGSAADAQHFIAELVNRFRIERRPLPAISLNADISVLTAISNDYGYDEIFAKQIYALGFQNDVLVCISTSGNSENVLRAITVAHEVGMKIVALTGGNGGRVAEMLHSDTDIEVRVLSTDTPRIQEVHTLIIHCFCDIIDGVLFS